MHIDIKIQALKYVKDDWEDIPLSYSTNSPAVARLLLGYGEDRYPEITPLGTLHIQPEPEKISTPQFSYTPELIGDFNPCPKTLTGAEPPNRTATITSDDLMAFFKSYQGKDRPIDSFRQSFEKEIDKHGDYILQVQGWISEKK